MAMTLGKPIHQRDNFPAHQMEPGTLYMTAQSDDRRKHLPVKMTALDTDKQKVCLSAWYPMMQSWQDTWVDWNYKVRHLQGDETMKLKASKAATAAKQDKPNQVAKKTIGKTTGVGIFQTWYVAFQKHGTDPKAVASFMKAEYPGRKTDWSKWANSMRGRYNAGKLGTKPTEPIKPYKTK